MIWQLPETKYWTNYLKKLVHEHFIETNSSLSKKIVESFDLEIKNFVQVCPKEMINKLENPIILKTKVEKVG